MKYDSINIINNLSTSKLSSVSLEYGQNLKLTHIFTLA